MDSSQSGGQKSQGASRAGFSQGFPPWLADSLPPVSLQGHPSVQVCVWLSSSYKDTIHTGLDPTPVASLNLNYAFKDFRPNTVTFSGTRDIN